MKRSSKQLICLAMMVTGLWPMVSWGRLDVVASTPDFGAVAEAIGGSKVKLTTLARPTEDPHFVDAKPSFIVKLNRADALVEGGAQLELGWLPALVESARNSKILSPPNLVLGSQGVPLVEVPATLDRSRGDLHAAGNPHYMVDPVAAKIVATHIANTLSELDPGSSETFKANLKKFNDAIDKKLAEWKKKLAPFQGEHVVAYHDAWPYFAARFGLKIDLFLEPKPGIPPSPAHLAEVVTRMQQEHARVIIVQPYFNRKTAEAVAQHTGATVVDVALFPGGVKGTSGDYIKLMDYLVDSLAKALAQNPK